MMENLTCFKAYDIRGKIGVEFNEEICANIGKAFAKVINAKSIVVGKDARASSDQLAEALIESLIGSGITVYEIGLSGTEETYWATKNFFACGGIQITASHNPENYNGMKLVGKEARPLDSETEFRKIKELVEANDLVFNERKGQLHKVEQVARKSYVKKIMDFVDFDCLPPLLIVVNSGNGAAGPTFDAIETELRSKAAPIVFDKMFHEPDSSFPNGVPNPLIESNQLVTKKRVLEKKADLGIAFDGDFDRCFFFDENGAFVPGQYVVGIIAEAFLGIEYGAKIVHDPRAIWNIQDIARKGGGISIQSKTGHAFIKQTMRNNEAIYGGELSAHHYFRDFSYCDSGMIPWLIIIQLMKKREKKLSELVRERFRLFPSSGEKNFVLNNPADAMKKVKDFYKPMADEIDLHDGLSITFKDWRFNLRSSNTETLLRLNIESREDAKLIKQKLHEIKSIVLS